MKVQFKYPRCINGQDYQKGIHELPDSVGSDWFFLACVNNGDVVIVGAPAKSEEPKQIDPPKPHAEAPRLSLGAAAFEGAKASESITDDSSAKDGSSQSDDSEEIIEEPGQDEVFEKEDQLEEPLEDEVPLKSGKEDKSSKGEKKPTPQQTKNKKGR